VGLGGPGPRSFRFALGLLAVAWVVVACTTPPPEAGPTGPVVGPTASPTAGAPTVLRLSTLEVDSLDPIDLDTSHELLLADQVYDGLVEYEPQSHQAVPALARDWGFAQKGAVIEFHLRKGLRFHDGTPVTAGDFVAAWSRLADPLVAAPFGFLLERVAGYDGFQRTPVDVLQGLEAPDDRTLVVRLKTPWPDFVALAGHPALAPIPAGADDRTLGTQPVGTGPYRVKGSLSPGAPVVLERFTRFHGDRPIIDELHFDPVSGHEEAWPDFLAGELDLATVPAAALVDAQGRFGTEGIVPLARLLYCGFNQEDERFRDPNLRLATSLALDWTGIAGQVYGGAAVPATGFVPPSLPGSLTDACGDRCRANPAQARELVREVPRDARRFSMDYAASPLGDALVASVAESLREVGLEVTPRAHDQEEYLELLVEDRQEFFCLVWTADYPRQQGMLEPLFLPGSGDNHAAIDDPGLTEVLHRAREQRSLTRRQRLYAKAEQRALARMRLIPVAWFRSRIAAQPYVEGLTVDPLGRFDAATVRIQG
jgi:oligopeptide transport system substrate-binding protein